MEAFSAEVIQQLNFYVYRLIDPRNGQTFYVGKGKGNRVFEHVKCAIDYYDGSDGISDEDPNKFRVIKDILDEGLQVIHIIQRWNLTEKEAYEVESALIDAFQGLSNIQSGHNTEFGVVNVEQLQQRLSCSIYVEPTNFRYLIIKVKQWRLNQMIEKFGIDYRYEATRGCWRIKPRSVNEYKYAFSVTDGIVREVYEIKSWKKSARENRYEFEGCVANENVRSKYINKRIPDTYCKKGMAAPVLFSKNLIK